MGAGGNATERLYLSMNAGRPSRSWSFEPPPGWGKPKVLVPPTEERRRSRRRVRRFGGKNNK